MTPPPHAGSGKPVGVIRETLHSRVVERFRPPPRGAWRETALLALAYLALAAPLAWGADLVTWGAPAPWWRLAILPLVPALLEETLWRGALLPARSRRPWLAALPQLALYVAAHPLYGATLRPAADGVFADPVFLLLALLLGAACTWLTLRHRSLWPAVALHAAVVIGWGLAGGLPPLG